MVWMLWISELSTPGNMDGRSGKFFWHSSLIRSSYVPNPCFAWSLRRSRYK